MIMRMYIIIERDHDIYLLCNCNLATRLYLTYRRDLTLRMCVCACCIVLYSDYFR